MNENPWVRLHRIVTKRIERLGYTQDEVQHEYGGPSPAWIRALKTHEGTPSARHNRALRSLDRALEWSADTARELLTEDRSEWTAEHLASEEYELVNDMTEPIKARIADFQTIVGRTLNAMPHDEASAKMAQILTLLGVFE